MNYTYIDPDGKEHAEIPAVWRVGGKVIALAGEWTRAERHGWTRAERTEPARWSKYRILSSLASRGLLEAFLGILKSDPLLYEMWLAAADIAEDDENFNRALPDVLAALGLSDAKARSMLGECRV